MTPDKEQALIKAAQNGDPEAFEALVRQNEKFVYNLALKLCGNPDDALDVSQDTFIKAYQNLGSFRGDSRLSVWLYRLCYNASMDHMRKNRSAGVASLSPDNDEDMAIDVADPAPQPEEISEKRELQRIVRQAVDKLPEKKRQIIIMSEFSDMSYSDISAALGISEGTVKSRLSRARASLAQILKENGTFSSFLASYGRKGGNQDE